SIFDTTHFMTGKRLPELFCGFRRLAGKAPTLYPVACSPQAWAVGAVFMLLQASLGMRIDASKNRIRFCQPRLPAFVNDITITNLRVNNKTLVLQIRKRAEGIDAAVLTPGADVDIEILEREPEFV